MQLIDRLDLIWHNLNQNSFFYISIIIFFENLDLYI